MSSFKQFVTGNVPASLRLPRLVLVILAPLVLAACSFSPVYGDRSAGSPIYDLTFASPGSRLEQIVINELVARFGRSSNPSALIVSVKVSSSSLKPGTSVSALEGVVTLTDPNAPGQPIFTATRTASASYATSGQSLANQQAANEAAERAALQLAQNIRLTLLGVLVNLDSDNADTSAIDPSPTAQ